MENELVCNKCGFAYQPSSQHWEAAVGFADLQASLPNFADIIRGTPLLDTTADKTSGAWFRQSRTPEIVLEDSCSYWTEENLENVKTKFRRYLSGRHLQLVEVQQPGLGRSYFHVYARMGDRFLRLEVMQENVRVWVKLSLMHQAAVKYDYPLQTALGIRENSIP